jgi:hypothetical protein
LPYYVHQVLPRLHQLLRGEDGFELPRREVRDFFVEVFEE